MHHCFSRDQKNGVRLHSSIFEFDTDDKTLQAAIQSWIEKYKPLQSYVLSTIEATNTYSATRNSIHCTGWSTAKQLNELREKLTLETMDFSVQFKFGEKDSKEIQGPESKGWAQEFLPNLSIGEGLSMISQYDNSDKYKKYDLIIDLSQKDLKGNWNRI